MTESTASSIPSIASSGHVPLPRRAARLAREWRWLHRTWWAVHYGVGLLGVAGGIVAAGTGADLFKNSSSLVTGFAGLLAAVCTSLVTFLGPLNKAQRYWTAFHKIDQTLLEYEEGLIDRPSMVKHVKDARALVIGGADDPNLKV